MSFSPFTGVGFDWHLYFSQGVRQVTPGPQGSPPGHPGSPGEPFGLAAGGQNGGFDVSRFIFFKKKYKVNPI